MHRSNSKINRIIEGRSMQKFKQHEKKSRFNNYIVNTPLINKKHDNKVVRQQSIQTQSASDILTQKQNKIQSSILLQMISKMSIRSSKDRRNGKIQRREVLNRQMTKNAIRKIKRFSTEQRDVPDQQQITSLKRYVNNLNAACNEIKKNAAMPSNSITQDYAREERKKFLMGQLSFTEIDEERILSQKKYLSRFEHLSKSVPKMVEAGRKWGKEHEGEILECMRAIDRVFVVLQQMESAGYPQRTNKFVIEFCVSGRMWLRRVFLAESEDRKDAFSMSVKYYVVGSAQVAKEKFGCELAKNREDTLQTFQADIAGLHEHIQSSLTHKKISKLINISQEIDHHVRRAGGKSLAMLARAVQAQGGRLTADLQQLQAQLGPMREISKISRRKFDELSRTYERLQGVL